MWELTVNLRDSADATAFMTGIDDRPEAETPGVRITKYPDDRQAVARSADRTPLAALATWAITFPSARLALSDDSASQEG